MADEDSVIKTEVAPEATNVDCISPPPPVKKADDFYLISDGSFDNESETDGDDDDHPLSALEEFSYQVEDAASYKAAKSFKSRGLTLNGNNVSGLARHKAAVAVSRKQAIAVKRAAGKAVTESTRLLRLNKQADRQIGLGSPVKASPIRPHSPIRGAVTGARDINAAPIKNNSEVLSDWDEVLPECMAAQETTTSPGVLGFEPTAFVSEDSSFSSIFGIPLTGNMFAALATEEESMVSTAANITLEDLGASECQSKPRRGGLFMRGLRFVGGIVVRLAQGAVGVVRNAGKVAKRVLGI